MMTDAPVVLGINRTQDAGVCLMQGSRLVWAIQKERLSRRKHHWGKPGDLRDFYLPHLPWPERPIDVVVECFSSDEEVARLPLYEEELAASLRLAPGCRRTRISHHLAHAYSVFPPAPFREAAVMIADGQGSPVSDLTEYWAGAAYVPGDWREVASFYRADRERVLCLGKQLWDRDDARLVGLGMFYFLLTQSMFPGEGNEGKVMGLAPHGDPRALKLPPLKVEAGQVGIPAAWRELLHERKRFRYGQPGVAFEDCANLAAAGQRAFEDALLEVARWLHAQTRLDSPRFRVVFYRWGDGPVPVWRTGWLPGRHAEDGAADCDWDWPAYGFEIPQDWPSAVYIAEFEEEGRKRAFDLARDHGAALFVVRAHRARDGGPRAGLLYKLPLATYHAYNFSGGACFYHQPPRAGNPPGARVSLRRPGGGIGGPVWGAADHYDASSPRQSFAHWDARFIRWLLRNGYAPDFCTDLDIHADPGILRGYRLLMSAGHDEYWSEATRDAVEDFVAGGGNVAFFAANLCWWRIHLVDGGAAMVCHQGGPRGAFDHWWPPSGAARPEDMLCGVSYRHGGGWWDGPRDSPGFIVQQPEHWIFAGTGLRRGDAFGQNSWPPLVGYECDGAPLDAFDASYGAVLSAWADEGGTPSSYQLLAAAPLGPHWQELPPRERHGPGEGVHAATLGIYRRNGSVFSAGTTDWIQVLGCGRDRRVERITRNVLDRLSQERLTELPGQGASSKTVR